MMLRVAAFAIACGLWLAGAAAAPALRFGPDPQPGGIWLADHDDDKHGHRHGHGRKIQAPQTRG
jgi:hypothetical protein